MSDYHCLGCGSSIHDIDTAVRGVGDPGYWHLSCYNRRSRGKRLIDHLVQGTAKADGAKCVPIRSCIDYTITPHRFVLDIPVEALANLTPDAHTRMLAMLNNWITEHKPLPLDKPQQEKKP